MLNIYIDESGSINNKFIHNNDFVITLVVSTDKRCLDRTYKRFVSKNLKRLKELDNNNKMFINDKFHELKGSQFDKPMKREFVRFFAKHKLFEIIYIRIKNCLLADKYCKNTARTFNYVIRLSLQHLLVNNYLANEDICLQLDERNEKSQAKHFLENYLNTELVLSGSAGGRFSVTYFDSANNRLIQLADVFSNLYYSHLLTNAYSDEIKLLQTKNILIYTYEFPF